jgi:DNA ligase-1
MASVSIQIRDFRAIPGELAGDRWVFPIVTTSNSRGQKRFWEIYVNLIDPKNPDKKIHVKDTYFDNTPIEYHGRIITINYQEGGKKTTTTPTIVATGKNLTKINATNTWTQALRDGLSKYNKRMKVITKPQVRNLDRYPPQLLKVYTRLVNIKDRWEVIESKDNTSIEYDNVFVQRKYDGVRAIARTGKDGEVELYSRTLGIYPGFISLKKQLKPILDKMPNLYLDGEIYKHGMSLQTISGFARNAKKECSKLEFHVFDSFYPPETPKGKFSSLTFSESIHMLGAIIPKTDKNIKVVETLRVVSEEAVFELFAKFIDEGYEGAVVRIGDSRYEFGYNNKRSNGALKIKPRYSEEFAIVDFAQGTKGKDCGAIIWVLQTLEGRAFSVVPKNITYAERYQLFAEMTPTVFAKKYKDKLMTVEFEDWSDDKIPLRAKAVAIRDYE